MNNYKINNKWMVTIKKKNFLLLLFVAFSILFSGATVTAAQGIISLGFHRTLYLLYIFVGLMVTRKYIFQFKYWNGTLGICALICIILLLANLINNPLSSFHFGIRVIWFLIIFCLCIFDREKAVESVFIYYKVIILLSFASLIVFVILSIYPLPYTIISSEDGYSYMKYLRFYYVMPNEIVTFPFISGNRVQCFFWEPGMFAVHLVLALYIELFIKIKQNIFNMFCLFICILLTNSTTGIILGVGVVVAHLFLNKKLNNYIRTILIIPSLYIAILVIYNVWNEKTAVMFIGSSYGNRMADIVLGVKLFLENILIGVGYNNLESYAYVFQNQYGLSRGNSNGLIVWLFSTGLIGAIPVLFPFIKDLVISKRKIYSAIFVCIFFLLSMTEPIMTSPVMMFLICSQYFKILSVSKKKNIFISFS